MSIESNKLIAEFMGWEVGLHGGREVEHCVQGQLETHKKVVGNWLSFQNMKYHKSWDWLMPVVRKLENEFHYNKKSPVYLLDFEDYYEYQMLKGLNIMEATIEQVYDAVVNLIQWYNKQQK